MTLYRHRRRIQVKYAANAPYRAVVHGVGQASYNHPGRKNVENPTSGVSQILQARFHPRFSLQRSHTTYEVCYGDRFVPYWKFGYLGDVLVLQACIAQLNEHRESIGLEAEDHDKVSHLGTRAQTNSDLIRLYKGLCWQLTLERLPENKDQTSGRQPELSDRPLNVSCTRNARKS